MNFKLWLMVMSVAADIATHPPENVLFVVHLLVGTGSAAADSSYDSSLWVFAKEVLLTVGVCLLYRMLVCGIVHKRLDGFG